MSSSRAKQDGNASSHLKSTQQELKKSVVDSADGATRGGSFKSTAQPLTEKKKTDGMAKKGGDNTKGAAGVNKQ